MSDTRRIVLELVPVAGAWATVPVERRLARLLRAARRSFGLRVVACRREPAVNPPSPVYETLNAKPKDQATYG